MAPDRSGIEGDDSGGVVQRALVRDSDIIDERGDTYNWTSFRGKRSEQEGGGAQERGRGARIQDDRKWKSSIVWGPVDPATGEGTSMSAAIGPDHNLGSSPSAPGAKARVDAFKALSGKSYIAGHLLTEKLGGPGDDPRNLTAISGTANTTQSASIESEVREPVNELGFWMSYSVKVVYTKASAVIEAAHAGKVAAYKAKGVNFAKQGNGYKVAVDYASRLDASWYPFDTEAAPARNTKSRSVVIQSPLDGGKAGLSKLAEAQDGSGEDIATTRIDAEELVLTTGTLLKHVVDARAPLTARIAELRKNFQALKESTEESEQTWREAHRLLLQQAEQVGYEAGWSHAYHMELATNGLGGYPLKSEMMKEEAFFKGYQEGQERGLSDAQAYIAGYHDGVHCGQNDLSKQYQSDGDEYIEGFDRGYQNGQQDGYYSYGKAYQFRGISLLKNIHERDHNTHYNTKSVSTIRMTGNKYPENSYPGQWYEVVLLSSGDYNLQDYVDTNFWMKRAWLGKGK